MASRSFAVNWTREATKVAYESVGRQKSLTSCLITNVDITYMFTFNPLCLMTLDD